MNSKKVVIVTGSSSGIGLLTAQKFCDNHYKCYGLSRTNNFSHPNFEFIETDVRDDKSVQNAIDLISKNENKIDVLVNNAGYMIVGCAENCSIEQAKGIFETNFFGIVRLTNAVLPLMHKQKYGRIINISSVAGFIPTPFMALYSSTKHAVSAYSEAIDHELRKFGIKVILIEPAYTKTNINNNALKSDLKLEMYTDREEGFLKFLNSNFAKATSAEKVVHSIYDAATNQTPLKKYRPGEEAKLYAFLKRFFPESLFDYGIRKILKLN